MGYRVSTDVKMEESVSHLIPERLFFRVPLFVLQKSEDLFGAFGRLT